MEMKPPLQDPASQETAMDWEVTGDMEGGKNGPREDK